MSSEKKAWIKQFMERWFNSEDLPGEEPAVPSPSPEQSPVPGDANGTEPELKVSPLAGEVSRKLNSLRNAVQFEKDSTSRLGDVHSIEDMLRYSYEVIFSKFISLQEIGLVNAQSSLAMDAIHQKYQNILEKSQSQPREIDPAEIASLEEENKNLRVQLRKVRTEFVKKGVISERELELDKEIEYLKKRMRELVIQLEIGRKKNEAAMASVEMANSLLAKNGLLNARLANQERLLRTLTSRSAKHREDFAKLEILREENTRLRDAIRQRVQPEEQLKTFLGGDSESSRMVDGLLASNRGLKEELTQKDNRLDTLASAETQEDMAEVIERLSNENYELKSIVETGQAIHDCTEAPENLESLHKRIADLLKVENQRLQTTLTAKEEQLKVLSANSANRPMMKAIMRLKDENDKLTKALDIQGRLSEQWEEEKRFLQSQARRAEELMKKNLAYKTRLQNRDQIIKSLQKVLAQYQDLKKEHSMVLSRYEAAQVEILNMKKRLSKITAQYDMMMKDYEGIFGQFK